MFLEKKNYYIIFNKSICISLLLFSGCNYELATTSYLSTGCNANNCDTEKNKQLTIELNSFYPYNSITRYMKHELCINNINVIENIYDTTIMHKNCESHKFSLNITHMSKKYITISVFPNGIKSEYQIILKIRAIFCTPPQINCYPVIVQTYRNFINNPEKALSNLIQENEILEEMYQDVARKLTRQFLNAIKK
ncbi:hypothetical protein BVAF_315 [Candidatus Blochmanniella vafra str. BVAF]|uniref:LPS-assembly lipoprotein LptE n=1 Tax=Blochmanniella vafra (strain BVAF) TaxID=859654 RepID=E8Q6W5_BLOVB|nr:hypothetical protein [Candidatus Blochmannia vafer]ADV33712.1 hypothetical protein BVAF_315 [Candidatus Blochmannia vafer str. BVAF]